MKKIMQGFALCAAILFMSTAVSFAEIYTIDPAHSEIGFAVKHMTVSTVKGSFPEVAGAIQFDPANPTQTTAEAVIQVASINTQVAKRDEHLRSPDFFDAEKYPTITFKTTAVTEGETGYTLVGDLTIHGTTKNVSIPCVINGPVKAPNGTEVIGLSGETTINRQDFGVLWNKTLDTGGFVVSNDVVVTVNIEAKRQLEVKEAESKEAPKK